MPTRGGTNSPTARPTHWALPPPALQQQPYVAAGRDLPPGLAKFSKASRPTSARRPGSGPRVSRRPARRASGQRSGPARAHRLKSPSARPRLITPEPGMSGSPGALMMRQPRGRRVKIRLNQWVAMPQLELRLTDQLSKDPVRRHGGAEVAGEMQGQLTTA
jgi:hypothetical protein